MSPSEFRTMFESVVEPKINWDQLIQLNPVISETRVSRVSALLDYYPPWYWPEKGNFDFADHSRLPVSIYHYVDAYLTPERIWAISCHSGSPKPTEIPCYQLPENRKLILDGNHRCLAYARIGRLDLLKFITIEGPINTTILPDLFRWSR